MKPVLAAFLTFASLIPAASAQTPPAKPAEAPNYEIENGALKVPGPILFETGSDKLKPESAGILQYVAGYLKAKETITLLRVENHADSDGDPRQSQTLTEKRALAVTRALVSKGVDCKRLIPVGFGSNKPIAANDSPDGKAQNRRTVFANAALRGRAIGGMPADGGGLVAGDPCK